MKTIIKNIHPAFALIAFAFAFAYSAPAQHLFVTARSSTTTAANALRVLAVTLTLRSRYVDERICRSPIRAQRWLPDQRYDRLGGGPNRLGRFAVRCASLDFDLDTSGRTSG